MEVKDLVKRIEKENPKMAKYLKDLHKKYESYYKLKMPMTAMSLLSMEIETMVKALVVMENITKKEQKQLINWYRSVK